MDANGGQLLAVLPDAALGECGEGIGLVGCDVYNLRDLSVGPAAFPVVSVGGEHVVVLVDLVGTFLSRDALRRVVLVDGIDVPSLDLHGRSGIAAVVALSLEVSVLDEVGLHRAILLAPFGLQREVGHSEGVDGHAVAIDEHAAVRRDGVAIGVEQSVGVVEGSSVGGIADSLLADEYILTVHQAHGGRAYIALEAESVGGDGIGQDAFAGIVCTRLYFNCVALVGKCAGIEGLRFDGRTIERRALRGDVL